MNGSEFLLPKDIYKAHLSSLNDVHFTEREIDVIACLLNGRRTSAIASLLIISPRTVTTHLQNIMRKLEINSQDGVIRFVERSPSFLLVKQHYARLVVHSVFEKSLKEVSRRKKGDLLEELLVYWENETLKNTLLYHLSHHLEKAGIQARIYEIQDSLENETRDKGTSLIFLSHKGTQQKDKNCLNSKALHLFEQSNYYLTVFEIIEALCPPLKEEKIHSLFEGQIEAYQNAFQSGEAPRSQEASLVSPENTLIFTKKITRKNIFLASLCLLVSLVGSFYLFTATKNNLTQEHQPQQNDIRSDLLIPNDYTLLQRSELCGAPFGLDRI